MVKAIATVEQQEAAAEIRASGAKRTRVSRKQSAQPPDSSTSGASSATSSALKSFGRFTYATMRRSQLHFAAYNPRTIDPSARRRLRAAIKHHGLVEPLVVNRRTDWTIVGGHQRTIVMDELADFDPADAASMSDNDYDIPVAIVDVPLAEEQALNVALNNPEIAGQYDLAMLEDLLSQPDFPVAATGFDKADLQVLLSPEALASIFGDQSPVVQQALAEAPIIETLNEMHAAGLEADREKRAADRAASGNTIPAAGPSVELQPAGDPSASCPSSASDLAADPAADAAAQRDLLIARRQAYIERSRDANDADFHCILIFDSSVQLDRFLSALNLDATQRYHDGPAAAKAMGIEVEDAQEEVDDATA